MIPTPNYSPVKKSDIPTRYWQFKRKEFFTIIPSFCRVFAWLQLVLMNEFGIRDNRVVISPPYIFPCPEFCRAIRELFKRDRIILRHSRFLAFLTTSLWSG